LCEREREHMASTADMESELIRHLETCKNIDKDTRKFQAAVQIWYMDKTFEFRKQLVDCIYTEILDEFFTLEDLDGKVVQTSMSARAKDIQLLRKNLGKVQDETIKAACNSIMESVERRPVSEPNELANVRLLIETFGIY
jgi:hypothetical protein